MILVIGNNELLGGALERHLKEQGFSVEGWDTSDIDLWMDIQSSSKGLLDTELILEKLSGVSIVINCSSFISYLKSDYQKLLKINVEGTANLMNGCLASEVEHYIHLSHIESFGFSQSKLIQQEDHIKSGNLKRSFYGLSRFLGDLEVQRASAEGLRTTILNCGYLLKDMIQNFEVFEQLVEAGFNQKLYGKNGYLLLEDAIRAVSKILNIESLPHDEYILISEVLDHNYLLSKVAEKKGVQLREGNVSLFKRWNLSRKLNNGIGYSKDYLDQMNRQYDFDKSRILNDLSLELSKLG